MVNNNRIYYKVAYVNMKTSDGDFTMKVKSMEDKTRNLSTDYDGISIHLKWELVTV